MLDVGHANEAGIMNRRWVGKLYVIETSPNFMLKLFLLQNLNTRSRKGTWNSSEMVWPAWSVLIRMWYFIYPWFEIKCLKKCGKVWPFAMFWRSKTDSEWFLKKSFLKKQNSLSSLKCLSFLRPVGHDIWGGAYPIFVTGTTGGAV